MRLVFSLAFQFLDVFLQRCLDELAANVEDFRRGGRRGRVI